MTKDFKKVVKIFLFCFFFLFIVSYGFSRSRDLLFGLKITNVSIVDGATLHDSSLPITGNARNAVKLTLNGREISISQAGDFSETVAPLPGYNIITLHAEDKFGFVDEKNYQLIFKP
jgi:hypothetical protein